jgi:putative membrane protein
MMYGFGGMGLVGGVVMLLVFVAVVLLVVWAVRAVMPSRLGVNETPMDTLRHRYAAGEINQAEFDQARRVLDGFGA